VLRVRPGRAGTPGLPIDPGVVAVTAARPQLSDFQCVDNGANFTLIAVSLLTSSDVIGEVAGTEEHTTLGLLVVSSLQVSATTGKSWRALRRAVT
jgi:hypothetical protein